MKTNQYFKETVFTLTSATGVSIILKFLDAKVVRGLRLKEG